MDIKWMLIKGTYCVRSLLVQQFCSRETLTGDHVGCLTHCLQMMENIFTPQNTDYLLKLGKRMSKKSSSYLKLDFLKRHKSYFVNMALNQYFVNIAQKCYNTRYHTSLRSRNNKSLFLSKNPWILQVTSPAKWSRRNS